MCSPLTFFKSILFPDNAGKFPTVVCMTRDGRLERAGRVKKVSSSHQNLATVNDGFSGMDMVRRGTLSEAIIAIGDEILSGWSVKQVAVVRNDVFLYGGIGPLHSDVSLAGVAKAFAVRLAPDEEFEDPKHSSKEQSTAMVNEMLLLPEGITESLHHENLPVPLIKCDNVLVLSSTNMSELDRQWDCLIDLSRSRGFMQLFEPFAVKPLTTNLSDVEVEQPLSKLCLEFPDLLIGAGPLIQWRNKFSPQNVS